MVTEFLPSGDADSQRVFQERRAFEKVTALTRIGATRPGYSTRLEDMIRRLAHEESVEDLKEAAARWYARVYAPKAMRLRAVRLSHSFPGERTADLVVHVEDMRAGEEARLRRPVRWEEALDLMVQH